MKNKKLMAVASLLAKLEGTMTKKAKKLGISRTTLWRWSKKVEVKEALASIVGDEFKLLAVELFQKLKARAQAGDLRAIRIYLELSGTSFTKRVVHPTELAIMELAAAGVTPAFYQAVYDDFVKPAGIHRAKQLRCRPSADCYSCPLFSSCRKLHR
jgi:hypothetical protein